MLNRALFEGMATACWACANPQLAAKRFVQHQRHHRSQWSKRYLESGVIKKPLPDIPGTEEQRELDKLFGPWGDRLWCGLPLHKLVAAIEDQWEEGARLKGFFVIAHATNNEMQHTTARSLLEPANESDASLQVRRRPEPPRRRHSAPRRSVVLRPPAQGDRGLLRGRRTRGDHAALQSR